MHLRFAICDLRSGLLVSMTVVCVLGGCIGDPQNPAATQPVTITDPATTQPSYWYDKPSPGVAVYDDFETLFTTCEDVLRDFGFAIDRVDYRNGVLTSHPLVSTQFFELWRPDVQTIGDRIESSLATIRRTIRFEFKRNDDGTFEVSPKVLVERQTVAERRITNVALYRGAYPGERVEDAPRGSRELDAGFRIPPRYWYPIDRDTELERTLARDVARRLARKGREMQPMPIPRELD